MRVEELLKAKEGPRLEFKRAAAVGDDVTIPRAVCSFLNSGGGTVLVGVQDDGSVEDIADPESLRRRIEDQLVSTIAPRAEVDVDVESSGGKALIRITVPRRPRGDLHAVASTRGRFLVPVRQGDRTVLLSWADVRRRLGAEPVPKGARAKSTEILDLLAQWTQRCEERSATLREQGGLYLVLRMELEERVVDLRERFESALRDPTTVGVGHGEGSFSDGRGEVRPARNALASGFEEEGYRWLEIATDEEFQLRFSTRLDASFRWGDTLEAKRESRLLQPYALSQTVSGCVSLAAKLVGDRLDAGTSIDGAVELRGLRGRTLPPGSPGPYGYLEKLVPSSVTEDPAPARQSMDVERFREHPHAFAKLLLDEVYRGFGWRPSEVPFYDSARSRFVYR